VLGYRYFFVHGKGDARGLLTVTQGGIVNNDWLLHDDLRSVGN